MVNNESTSDVAPAVSTPAVGGHAVGNQGEQSGNYDDFFIKLIAEEEAKQAPAPAVGTPAVGDQTPAVGTPAVGRPAVGDQGGSVKDVLARHGLRSYDELKQLEDSDPERYYDILGDMNNARLTKHISNQVGAMQHGMYIEGVLAQCKNAGVNPKDFQAYCQYSGCPVNERNLENYLAVLSSKGRGNNTAIINQVASSQGHNSLSSTPSANLKEAKSEDDQWWDEIVAIEKMS